uniref:Uncharacterized protein n=1 Tax=Strigamia maritima TaxID=126957 RepID=T1JNI1_STRMM
MGGAISYFMVARETDFLMYRLCGGNAADNAKWLILNCKCLLLLFHYKLQSEDMMKQSLSRT